MQRQFHSDYGAGRFEGARLPVKEYRSEDAAVRVFSETPGGEYRVETVYCLDEKAGRRPILSISLAQPALIVVGL